MAANRNLQQLHEAGVSIWLDTLSRQLLRSGEFAELIGDYSVTGATSNPTIFAKAITGSDLYDSQVRELTAAGGSDLQELFFALALDDVRDAAALLRPAYESSGGRDGFISFECTPDLADDTDATIAQATELWRRLDRPNVMIKVPGTEAGLPAIEELTSSRGPAGCSCSATAPGRSGRCGPARAPRTPRPLTSCTSRPWRRRSR